MRHDIDGLSLVLGLVFAAVAVAGLNGWITPDLLRVEWLLPGALVVLGLVLLGVLLPRLARRDPDGPEAGDAQPGAPDSAA
ncbi:hypothetical protein [Salsipaludibacter albus]|uniref:hypothetical protein n=1 Tax=Salsipaludibacter albus TaxID=2849650 RepID=UPI001EE49E69|nr:hypothetical protein [Salsipaludibacter albus]MBY5161186.1 hypothetical protein [Salsipaludibacter albus]